MGVVVALPRPGGGTTMDPGHANRVRWYMDPGRWITWCRARGLDVYGMPGEEFAGPRADERGEEEGDGR